MNTTSTAQLAVRRLVTVLYPGFELLDIFGPLEMFGALKPEIEIIMVAERAGAIASFQGPCCVAECAFAECQQADLLLVPGGMGTVTQLKNVALLDFLRRQSRDAERVMSVCSGSALLARAGLLNGMRATSNKFFFNLAVQQCKEVHWVSEARWVEDGRFVTSSGVSAGIDMALGVIAGLFGEARAKLIAELTEYQWHCDSTADPFAKFLDQGDTDQLLRISGNEAQLNELQDMNSKMG